MEYRKFNDYLKEKYGGRIQKIAIDAGFTCPNRDGSKASGGCTFCNNQSFSPFAMTKQTVKTQMEKSMNFYKSKFKNIKGFIAYFQAFTNTYAPVEKLMEVYDQAMEYPEIIGMSIGTRPDCAGENVLDLISSYTTEKPEIWVEYGIQTAHFKTLRAINRAHGVADFIDAVLRTKKRSGIKVCAHVILGLPGEDYEDMMETAKLIAALPIDGIKIHPLHIVKHTVMEKQYLKGEIKPLDLHEYAKLVVDFMSYLPKDIIVHRITGEATDDELLAPFWCSPKYKMQVLDAIKQEFENKKKNQSLKLTFI